MRYYKIGRSVLASLLVILSASVVPKLSVGLMTSRVLAQRVDVRKTEADRLTQQGLEKSENGEIQEAINYWQKALNIYQKKGNKLKQVNVLNHLGVAKFSQGKYQNAKEYHQHSLAIARQIRYREGEAQSLNYLGNAYCFFKQCRKAIELHQQALSIAQLTGLNKEKVKSLNGLGNAYRFIDIEKATKFYEQSLIIAKDINYKEGRAKALTNLGGVYVSQKQYEKAIELLKQSLAIVQKKSDRITQAIILDNLGHIYTLLGRYQKAIESSQQALYIYKILGNKEGELRKLIGLGIIYNNLNQYQKAIEFHQESLAIAKKLDNKRLEATSYGNLGVANYFIGKYRKAIEFHQEALDIYRQLSFTEGVGLTFGNLGLAYSSLGENQKALEFYRKSLVIARELEDREREGNALNNIGLAYIKIGQYANASTTLLKAINVYESIRLSGLNDANKISIFDTYSRSYRLLQQAFIADNKPLQALEIAEGGRARAFVELLASKFLENTNSQSNIKAPRIKDIRKVAKEQNATLVQYSIIASELYIWVIKPTGEVTFRKADLKPLLQKENTTLDELVTTSRQSIGARGTNFRSIKVTYDPNAPKATNKLKRLHELLIEPIADLLPKKPSARVTFIPQGSLFLVPFPALQDKDGKYLIEKHTILTSPSIQVLDLTRRKRQRIGEQPIEASNMLIVGNPIMPKIPPKIGEPAQQLTPLPGAETEAKAIANLFGAKPLIGKEATETQVTQRLSQARLIHLATHGIFDDVQGLNSGIALTPDSTSPLVKGGQKEGSDGLLTAGEILNLKLNAELVVLSACDTGRGRITGDGVIGLSRSWISAGVPSVVVSLWSVPDAPTAQLMTEFYQNFQNNPDKAQALRQAMLKIMKQHPNPRDWAAFTLIGEAE